MNRRCFMRMTLVVAVIRPLPVLLAMCGAFPIAAAQPALQFSPRALSVRGVTPGGNAMIFGVSYGPTATTPPLPFRSRHAELLSDSDGDGIVTLPFERDIPTMAAWVVVDVQSGRWVAQGSPGFEPRLLPLQGLVRNDNAGQLRKLTARLPEVEVLLVRPAEGAWVLHAAKRSRVDEGGPGEPLRVDIEHARPVGASPRSAHTFRPGDVVAIIDPLKMAYLVTEVGR